MVTRAIWPHLNEVMFRGRPVSTDGVVHEVEGLMTSLLTESHRVTKGGIGLGGELGTNRSQTMSNTTQSGDRPFCISKK